MNLRRVFLGAAILSVLASILVSFLVQPDAALFRGRLTARIFYFHVPAAWVAYLAFGVTALASLLVLRSGAPSHDATALASAEVGVTFSLIALFTGVTWSTIEFGGSYSAIRDPTVLSLAVVILTYFAYFALRSGIDERPRRRRLAAVFGILAVIGVPLSYLAIKRSVHPDFTRPDQELAPELRAGLLFATAAFTLLYVALLVERRALARLEDDIDDLERNT